ncbi:leukocyte-associated immunoglobulin-like receptor 2 isoform 1-T1 [Hipposideros larvatus]
MLAMSSNPTTLLGLMLCLGQGIHMQNWRLPRPSIRAEPGPVVARGRPVTILCRGPAGVHRFRLEQKNTFAFMDQKNISQRGSLETEARFLIPAVSEVSAVPYRCAYKKGSNWSERSDVLELVLTDEDVPVLPSGAPHEVTHPHTEADSQTGKSPGNVSKGSAGQDRFCAQRSRSSCLIGPGLGWVLSTC